MLIGYAAYMFVHHATHHLKIEPGDWLYEARVRHMAHHYRDATNFGVSTGFWDRVFGTERAPPRQVRADLNGGAEVAANRSSGISLAFWAAFSRRPPARELT